MCIRSVSVVISLGDLYVCIHHQVLISSDDVVVSMIADASFAAEKALIHMSKMKHAVKKDKSWSMWRRDVTNKVINIEAQTTADLCSLVSCARQGGKLSFETAQQDDLQELKSILHSNVASLMGNMEELEVLDETSILIAENSQQLKKSALATRPCCGCCPRHLCMGCTVL